MAFLYFLDEDNHLTDMYEKHTEINWTNSVSPRTIIYSPTYLFSDSLEKMLMLEKTERKRKGWQGLEWLGGITGSVDRNLSKLQELVSSALAWRIPWTEEPGGLQSMGSRLSDFTLTFHFHALEKEMATHSSTPA